LAPGKVGMYLCGPTVYAEAHIGHMVGPVIFDTVKRYLTYCGYDVTWVVNITDVDDKLIVRSREKGISMFQLATQMTADYLSNLQALGVDQIDRMPRATDSIGEIISFVQELIDKGFAYASDGDVFFDVTKDPEYGCLSNRSPDEQQGEGGGAASRKRSAGDFALWKSAKPGEPSWPSPWGQGRPGWHIECSAMSESILGTPIDIHGGGADLQFPHHENEIAQSEAAMEDQKHPFVRYWMHNGFVRVDNEKMSKSLGNFFTIREVVDQFDPEVLRLYILRAHYRSPLNYSDAHLDDARLALLRLYGALSTTAEASSASMMPATSYSLSDQASDGLSAHWQARFAEAMNDDFNTPVGVAVLFDLAAEVYRAREHGDEPRAIALEACLRAFAKTLGLLDQDPALVRESGLLGQARRSAALGDEAIEAMVSERGEAKKARDFQRADRLRDELGKAGIVLEDSPQGTRWRRQ